MCLYADDTNMIVTGKSPDDIEISAYIDLAAIKFVDYGNTESVDNNSVWAMEPQFATLPIQAFSCSLAGVQPVGDSWPVANSTELDLQFDAETLECTVLQSTDEESKYLVKLSKQGEDLAQKIIEAGFAIASSEDAAFELDTTLLVNQLLRVTLLRLGEDYSLYVQPAPEDAENILVVKSCWLWMGKSVSGTCFNYFLFFQSKALCMK
ncbi:hypothetical protein J6590_042402 [Homalodisca vitripennis]|nr:hypothetical protein J6590_042402 [Homalodisca vitripennis]